MATTVLRCEGLTKYYGKTRGVEKLSFEVRPGQVFGYLGPNGAGKTTTIRCVLGLLGLTAGRCYLFDREVTLTDSSPLARVGYVPGDVALFPASTGRWVIDYISGLRGRPPLSEGELIDRLRFDPSRKVKELSKGNRQKLALIVALMHNPELLILDEPTTGLDPIIQQEFFDIVAERIAEHGATVFLSSHILSEVERICDRVGVIREGTLVAEESTKDLIAKAIRKVRITYQDPVVVTDFAGVQGVSDLTQIDARTISAKVKTDLDGAIRGLMSREIADIQVTHASLEEIFFEYYAREGEQAPRAESDSGRLPRGESAADARQGEGEAS